jgi:hypothetical protein
LVERRLFANPAARSGLENTDCAELKSMPDKSKPAGSRWRARGPGFSTLHRR